MLGAEVADFATVAIDDDVARAILPAQQLIVHFLDAAFADYVARFIGCVARLVQVFFAYLADIPDDVRCKAVARIKSTFALDCLQFRKLVAMRLNEGLFIRGYVRLDGNGLITGRGTKTAKSRAQLFNIKMKAASDQGQVGIDVAILLAHQ